MKTLNCSRLICLLFACVFFAAGIMTGNAARQTGEPGKASLAVMPAVFARHFSPEVQISDNISVSGDVNLDILFSPEHERSMQAPSLTLSLAEAFVGSRKFDVLERSRLREILREVDFGTSEYANAAEVVPLGKALNAEYVLLPEIELIHLLAESSEVPYVGTVQNMLKGKIIVRHRVVDTASTKMVVASSEEIHIERTLRADGAFATTEMNNFIMELYRAAGMRMLHRTLEAVYPVRILEIDGEKAVVNRGEGAINLGDEFDVYMLGKTYIDPDTGESLGRSENQVARIRVNRIAPRFAEARIVEGVDSLTGKLSEYLCRETETSIQRKTRLERKPIAW